MYYYLLDCKMTNNILLTYSYSVIMQYLVFIFPIYIRLLALYTSAKLLSKKMMFHAMLFNQKVYQCSLVIGKTSDTTILIYFNTSSFQVLLYWMFRMYLPLKVENILQFNKLVRKLDQQVNQPKNGLLEGKFNMTFLHIFTQLLCRRQVEDKPPYS